MTLPFRKLAVLRIRRAASHVEAIVLDDALYAIQSGCYKLVILPKRGRSSAEFRVPILLSETTWISWADTFAGPDDLLYIVESLLNGYRMRT